MLEYASVSASSYDPAALVARLNEKSAEGWSVVSIVATGSDVTAFLSRESTSGTATSASTSGASAASASPTPVVAAVEPVAASSVATAAVVEPAVAEPAGWAVAPQPASQQPQQVEQPSVPAQWAADPMNRFELRYWDGTRWTEHVSRAGQQYVDPI